MENLCFGITLTIFGGGNYCNPANLTFTRFKHLAESKEELKKILDERRVDEILLFLEKSDDDKHLGFQVRFSCVSISAVQSVSVFDSSSFRFSSISSTSQGPQPTPVH